MKKIIKNQIQRTLKTVKEVKIVKAMINPKIQKTLILKKFMKISILNQ